MRSGPSQSWWRRHNSSRWTLVDVSSATGLDGRWSRRSKGFRCPARDGQRKGIITWIRRLTAALMIQLVLPETLVTKIMQANNPIAPIKAQLRRSNSKIIPYLTFVLVLRLMGTALVAEGTKTYCLRSRISTKSLFQIPMEAHSVGMLIKIHQRSVSPRPR